MTKFCYRFWSWKKLAVINAKEGQDSIILLLLLYQINPQITGKISLTECLTNKTLFGGLRDVHK